MPQARMNKTAYSLHMRYTGLHFHIANEEGERGKSGREKEKGNTVVLRFVMF